MRFHSAIGTRLSRKRCSQDFVTLEWLTDIRPLDADGIVTLMNCIIERENTIGFVERLTQIQQAEIVDGLAGEIKKNRKHVLVARSEEKIIGLVILTPHLLPNCRHLAELTRGIIHPLYRRRGILQRAFIAIVEKCELLHISRLVLDVRTGSPGHALWSKVGFEPFGVLADYVRIDGVPQSGTFMTASLEQLRESFSRAKL